jgi:hypothetical protein
MIEIPNINLAPEPIEIDFKSMFENSFIDIDVDMPPPPIALSIGSHPYKGNTFPTQYGSYGDFSCIVGASKSKKTFLKSLLIASYLGGNAHRYAPSIKGHDAKDKYVIELDTEQSKYHCQKVFRRVAEIVGKNPENYKPFSLRGFTVKERLQFIEYIFLESEYRGKIGLASIDGVADLVDFVNNEEQSYAVAQKLLEWSEKSKSHIITVLHRNFASNKPTGHLGSAVLKKAETVVFIDKDEELVKAVPEYTRNIPFDDFKFAIDEDWLPYVVQDEIRVKDYTMPKNSKEDDVPF